MSSNKRLRQIEKLVIDVFKTNIDAIGGYNAVGRTKDGGLISFINGATLADITISDTGADWCASFALNIVTGLLQEGAGTNFILTEDGGFLLQES